MPVSLKYVTQRMPRDHWILQKRRPKELPPAARRFWTYLRGATGAVLAYDGDELVGFFRWDNDHSQGTWVHPDYRRTGLALCMWELMLLKRNPRTFVVSTVTRAGKAFAKALAAAHPEVAWELEAL